MTTVTANCAIYLLKVPEFEPLMRGLEATPGITLAHRGDYCVAEAADEIVLLRDAVGVGQAVWFGALTGGVTGRIVEFTEQVLRIAPLNGDR